MAVAFESSRMGWRRVLRVLGSAPKPDVVSDLARGE